MYKYFVMLTDAYRSITNYWMSWALGIALSIFNTRHQSVQLFFSVSEGSFQYCKLGILFKRNHVLKEIKTRPKTPYL